MGLLGSTKLRITEGNRSIHKILEERDIDPISFEGLGMHKEIKLPSPFFINNSLKEEIKIDIIFLEEPKYLYELEFEDGKKYIFSLDHELLMVFSDRTEWIESSKLSEGDPIMFLDKKFNIGSQKIISKKLFEKGPTWDVRDEKYYFLENGVVTHNRKTLKKKNKRKVTYADIDNGQLYNKPR